MSARSAAKAVRYDRFGSTEVLDVVEVPVPVPGEGEVIVEVLAAGINHMEAFIRAGEFDSPDSGEFPHPQGTDLAGIVTAVGPGVTAFKVGAEVVGHARNGSHATHVLVKAADLVPKPKAVSWEVGGALFLAGIAAYEGVEAIRARPGETVVVTAAAGGVGSIEVQLLLLAGVRVIGTCGERNADYLRQIGVVPVIYGDGIVDRIRAVAPNGVAAVIDNFGQDDLGTARELGVATDRIRTSADRKEIELRAVWPDADTASRNTEVLRMLLDLVAAQSLRILISGFYPLDLVRDAYDDLEKRHARGKIVLGMRPVNSAKVMKARDVSDARA